MSLLSLVQDTAKATRLLVPAAVINNSEDTAVDLLSVATQAARWVANYCKWTDLVVEDNITTVTSQRDYTLPTDFREIINNTLWNEDTLRPIRGALTPQEWQYRINATLATSDFEFTYRIRNISGVKKLSLDAVPASPAGDTLVYEYITKNWCETSGGTGQLNWAADTDVAVIDEELILLEMIWRTLSKNGSSYQEEFAEAKNQIKQARARDKSSPIINLNRRRRLFTENVQDSDFPSS